VSQKYPGGLIRKTPPTTVGPVDGEGGSAPGIWTLEQAMELQKQNLWPKPLIPRALYSWGQNAAGQLGQGSTTNLSSPVQVGSATDWGKYAAIGNAHALALTYRGALFATGQNASGQLGFGFTFMDFSTFSQVGALTNWLDVVATNASSSFAVKKDGTLWSWGFGGSGVLGHNNTTSFSSPAQVGSLSTWYQVTSNNSFTLAIKTDGTLWSWGENSYGQLGQNNTTNRSSPVQVGGLTNWEHVSAGSNQCVAIKTDGTLWSWGRNANGELGQGDTTHRSSPVQVGALTNWAKVSSGQNFCLAIKTDGTLWSWGQNTSGQLGINSAAGENRSSPVQVGALTNWAQISAGEGHGLAMDTSNKLFAWGFNSSGQIGQNDTASRSSPVQVGALTSWTKLATNQGNSSLVIKLQ
jgi:alpha-tubulin suppressor-like RCC1 family protein